MILGRRLTAAAWERQEAPGVSYAFSLPSGRAPRCLPPSCPPHCFPLKPVELFKTLVRSLGKFPNMNPDQFGKISMF